MTEVKSPLLNRKELANRIGLTPRMVHNLTRSRKIPHVRMGKRVIRYYEADVRASIEEMTLQPEKRLQDE